MVVCLGGGGGGYSCCSWLFPSSLSGSKGPKLLVQRRKTFRIYSALPETAISVAVAATVVGGAVTLLIRRTESQKSQAPVKICEDCSGSGICSECRGEGFVLQKLSDESAERARLTSTNAATRYTSGYSSKCFQENGAIAPNAHLVDLVVPAVEVGS